MNYSKEQLIEMYEIMLKGRIYDETIKSESNKGKLMGMFHLGIGQEATGAAIASALGPKDIMMPGHRMHTAILHRMDMNRYTSELMGKRDGYSKGVGAEFHTFSLEEGIFPIYSLLGGGFAHSAGYALAMKRKKTGGVMVAVIGDGGFQAGGNYEGMNMAALYKLPIVFVIENNHIAMTTPLETHASIENLAERAEGFGMTGITIDPGTDVIEVRKAIDQAIEKARNFEPSVIEVKTHRLEGHYYGDVREYLDKQNEAARFEHYGDPIVRLENFMFEEKLLTQTEADELKEKVTKQVIEAFDHAYGQEMTNVDDVRDLQLTYANPEEALR
ncbi:thiamine pyrophosphate-dependent dehydrogenase E1 component subunit alpha [Peribacillus frigoritolerans]|uniref:thiamine pyrophosphate-dependent dehydrogenase E1 component subunit alpha n=1 Tax=Peribacillus frigoritolerans TaxID=450367 RepID=UPI003D2983EC